MADQNIYKQAFDKGKEAQEKLNELVEEFKRFSKTKNQQIIENDNLIQTKIYTSKAKYVLDNVYKGNDYVEGYLEELKNFDQYLVKSVRTLDEVIAQIITDWNAKIKNKNDRFIEAMKEILGGQTAAQELYDEVLQIIKEMDEMATDGLEAYSQEIKSQITKIETHVIVEAENKYREIMKKDPTTFNGARSKKDWTDNQLQGFPY